MFLTSWIKREKVLDFYSNLYAVWKTGIFSRHSVFWYAKLCAQLSKPLLIQ